MKCPQCVVSLAPTILLNTEIDYCPRCYGLWFEEDELREAKDDKDRDLRWLDIDLWRDPTLFRISAQGKLCPVERMPLYEVRYGDSDVAVDVCNVCHGIWLDRGEFKSIVVYVREKAEHRVLYHYARDVFEEMKEVFSGPEMLREEILDFLTVLKLLVYKFTVQYAALSRVITTLPH